MKFIFWQNIVSIHQAAFLKALAERHEVILAAEEPLSRERAAEGWNVPDMGKVEIIVAPDAPQISRLLEQNRTSVHCFSGIDAFPMVYRAFRRACKLGIRPMLYLEPYEWRGWKGLLRRVKYTVHRLRYGKSIRAILTTGSRGRICYEQASFPAETIFDWGYFTEAPPRKAPDGVEQTGAHDAPRLLFVGRLDENKRILPLLDELTELQGNFSRMDIIGRGPLETEVRERTASCGKYSFLGVKTNHDVQELMQGADLLILPSLYDGWGTVVNEALQNGMRVLCSDACGASALLDGHIRGASFPATSHTEMNKALKHWIGKGKVSPEMRRLISEWSAGHISGEAAARYFEHICSYVQGNAEQRPEAPWMEKQQHETTGI